MHSASSVKARAFALAGILAVWATGAIAQENGDVAQQEPVAEDTVEQPIAVVPRAPLRVQRNTLCDTSYSRMTNCNEQNEDEEQPLDGE
jgi:hypothetical protein